MEPSERYDRPMATVVGTRYATVRPRALALIRDRELLVTALIVGVLTPLAAGNGGYFPVAWGWAAIGLGAAALLGVVLQARLELTGTERVTLVAWVALAGWTALSIAWSADVTQSVLEVERLLVYVAAVWALLVIGHRRSARGLLVAILIAVSVICSYALGTHLLPERLGVHRDFIEPGRLSVPIGYWNALGIFAGTGYLVGLGFAARPHERWLRIAGALPLPMLAATMYFTFGRGAWVSVAAGAAAVVVVAAGRLRYLLTLLVLAPWTAVPVVWGAHSRALTAVVPNVRAVESPGHELTWIVALCCVGSALTAGVLAALERRISPGTTARKTFAALLVAAALLAGGVTVSHYGGPSHIVAQAHASLEQRSPDTGGPLATRLFSLSLNGRPDMWRAAFKEVQAHPVLGDGAGAYERFWLRHRTVPMDVRDAHSLFLETLSELGPIGLVLLLIALGTPLYAAARARRRTLVPVALAPYVALLSHAAADWDWEVPAITVAGIACGTALLLAARTRDRQAPTGRWTAWALPVVPAAIVAIAVLGLLSNRALSAASGAVATHNWAAAASQANTAHRWAPWSYQPYDAAGRVAVGAGDRAAAVRAFQAAIRVDANDWVAWDGLAQVTRGRLQLQAEARASRLNPLAYTP